MLFIVLVSGSTFAVEVSREIRYICEGLLRKEMCVNCTGFEAIGMSEATIAMNNLRKVIACREVHAWLSILLYFGKSLTHLWCKVQMLVDGMMAYLAVNLQKTYHIACDTGKEVSIALC